MFDCFAPSFFIYIYLGSRRRNTNQELVIQIRNLYSSFYSPHSRVLLAHILLKITCFKKRKLKIKKPSSASIRLFLCKYIIIFHVVWLSLSTHFLFFWEIYWLLDSKLNQQKRKVTFMNFYFVFSLFSFFLVVQFSFFLFSINYSFLFFFWKIFAAQNIATAKPVERASENVFIFSFP